MDRAKRIVGVVGSYRKDGFIDSAVNEVLFAAHAQGADTEKIYLLDQHIEFCTNCRTCTQTPGSERGDCVLTDDMQTVLAKIERADCVVIGAPVNFGEVNALTRRFLERCIGFCYWPWGAIAPKMRTQSKTKTAVLISSSAAPGWLSRISSRAMGSLRKLSDLLGAKPVGTLFVGLVNRREVRLSERALRRARFLGRKLAL